MKRDGFTLIEFLVAMTIMLLLLLFTTKSFQRISHNVKSSTAASQTRGDNLSANELLRLDLEHAGTGIATYIDSTATINDIPPVFWDGSSLLIHSTLSNTNSATMGWATGSCSSGSFSLDIEQRDNDSQNSILIDKDSIYNEDITTTGCSGNNIYIVYPYANGATSCGSSSNQPCTQTEYRLSASQPIDSCAANTRNILRNDTPLFTCIADFAIRVDWDKDDDGTVEADETNLDPSKTTDIPAAETGSTLTVRNKLKTSTVYILAQIGKKDETYTYGGPSPSLGDGKISFSIDGEAVQFQTLFTTGDEIEEFKRYQWKVLKITAFAKGF
ncbi:PulJ/GspJ family protein [Desulfotalea psychrophila]|uniref:Prepilin-type N-terminal cleavage/methylation domain-containing protein n=1 Tax=Desulfotalea psychrophila (strain LSv54 / DSM 12343) TaxID=177439 RepID=Q6AN79_DESPS|nr:prepilin-type N-terminal cleavage/methylation domain-containing protein [Desulfotalea psychrophila]CAG36195.1 unknown protein [Desulfotalea psychrophila LSv54]